MKKVIMLLLALLLAGGLGGGAFYRYVYNDPASVNTNTSDVVYADSVRMLAGLGSGTGVNQRFAGVVEPLDTWSAKLENERTVEETYVEVGDAVKKGDKLFKYDITSEEDSIEEIQIDIESTLNNIDAEKRNIESYKKQYGKANAEEKEEIDISIMQSENTIKQAEYTIKSKELEKKKHETNIENSTVYSQMDGVVKSINDQNNDSSDFSGVSNSSDSDGYITIMETGKFRVKGTINEQNISDIVTGEDMLCFSRVDSSQFWRGSISTINTDKDDKSNEDSYYGYSDNQNGSSSYSFYVELDSSEGLMLGQHLYMEIDRGQDRKKSGIWLMTDYVLQNADGTNFVWAVDGRDRLEKRTVTLGKEDEETLSVQIAQGLTTNDYIVLPSDDCKEGVPVVKNDQYEDSGDNEIDVGEDFFDDFDEEEDFGGTFVESFEDDFAA